MICDLSCRVFSSVCRELERIESRFPLFYYGCHRIIFENYVLEITECEKNSKEIHHPGSPQTGHHALKMIKHYETFKFM